MSLIDELQEKEMLQKWAEENQDETVFGALEWEIADRDSYYVDRQGTDTCLMEYGFSNIRELEELCKTVWSSEGLDRISRIVAVAALKCMPSNEDFTEKSEIQAKDALEKRGNVPEHIYVF